MGKVCVACGSGSDESTKPLHVAEDCPDCGGEGTMQPEKDDSGMEEGAVDGASDDSDEEELA